MDYPQVPCEMRSRRMWARSGIVCQHGSSKFFRSSLIGQSPELIQERLVRLDNQVKDFKQELFRISWYMRGGVSVNDLMDRYSFDDRETMYEIIKDNIEATKESQMPLL